MVCRHCHKKLEHVFLNLGSAPPSNAYRKPENLHEPEINYPLIIYVCENCWLVQTQDFARADELFNEDYAYFSSVSTSWLEHAAVYCKMITERLGLKRSDFVLEIASNDGYLLKNFVSAGIPCLGIEPTASTALEADRKGIPTIRRFFGENLAKELSLSNKQASLIVGNNVYAHVPDINDFTAGLKLALNETGTITLEFPHLLNLIEEAQFDTVYHEHFSYFSLRTVIRIFREFGLRVFDCEKLNTHGGSLRVYGCHTEDPRTESSTVSAIVEEEESKGLRSIDTYLDFQNKANRVKDDFLLFLIEQKRLGKSVAAYGAAAKGNTLLNYAGVKTDLIQFVSDAAPSKQGKYLPGSQIPILSPNALMKHKPDWVVVLPWNIAEEVKQQISYIGEWGGKCVVAVPSLRIV